MTETLITTKFHIPPAPTRAVKRERLIAQLNDSRTSKLTLISAPAGFGKTTLVSMWAEQVSMPIAWLSLDKEDNDIARFLAYIITSFQRVTPNIGKDAFGFLQNPHTPSYEIILTALLNDLAESSLHIILVLDDFHLIHSQTIYKAVIFLLDHLPLQTHLVIVTRADPSLPLPLLRARGHLTELRQKDLRFTPEEAASYLNNIMGLDLSSNDVEALENRTEGWITGLQMAALSLKGHSPQPMKRASFIQAFTGSHRFVLDFLVEEVLDQQPPVLQEFLLKTSILDRLCGPLCDALLERHETIRFDQINETHNHALSFSDSQAILEQLETANLFIIPLDDDRRWYRYHQLFADLLQKRLKGTDPSLLPKLHNRASAWYEHQDMLSQAIDHALAACDFERAAALIEKIVEFLFMRSEIITFLNWVDKLPDENINSHPTIRIFQVWALLMSGRSVDIFEQHLQNIAINPDTAEKTRIITARVTALRAYLMVVQANMRRAAELCHQALEHLPEKDIFFRSILAWILSLTHVADVDLNSGQQALKEITRMGQEIGNPLIAVASLCHQARLKMRQGHLHQAKKCLEEALHLATDSQGEHLPVASKALIGLGELEREWNNLDVAERYLSESIELAGQWSELAGFDAYFPLARTKLAQGNGKAAREAIETARQIAYKSKITQVDDFVSDIQRAFLSISLGEIDEVFHWAQTRGLLPGNLPETHPDSDPNVDYLSSHLQKYEKLIIARLLIYQNKITNALDVLDELLFQARQLGRVDLMIEIQILRALAFQKNEDDELAFASIAEVLSLTESEGYQRTFLDVGEPMVRLLRLAISRGMASTYAVKLLEAFNELASDEMKSNSSFLQNQPLIDPISERELDVLKLLATGMSNPEIADSLVVAVSTIRSHCKNIYSKLNVHNRWDAVQRAKELGLI